MHTLQDLVSVSHNGGKSIYRSVDLPHVSIMPRLPVFDTAVALCRRMKLIKQRAAADAITNTGGGLKTKPPTEPAVELRRFSSLHLWTGPGFPRARARNTSRSKLCIMHGIVTNSSERCSYRLFSSRSAVGKGLPAHRALHGIFMIGEGAVVALL